MGFNLHRSFNKLFCVPKDLQMPHGIHCKGFHLERILFMRNIFSALFWSLLTANDSEQHRRTVFLLMRPNMN